MNNFFFLPAFVCFLAVAHIAGAQTPDSSYAVNAISANAISNTASCMAQQPDGKTILGTSGWFELHRFTDTGFPDTAFGVGGRAFVVFDTGAYSNAKVYDIAIQPDGKIIAVGSATYCLPTMCGVTYLMCARFLPNGLPDSTFGTFGYMRSDVFFHSSMAITVQTSCLSRVRILPSGKILFAGMAQQVTSGSIIQAFITRYNSDGTPDGTYGTGGFSWLPNLYQTPDDMYLYPDASVLAVGNASDISHWYMKMFKIDSTGASVSSFGTAGVDTFSCTVYGYSTAIGVRPDGKIILLGNLINDTVGDYAGVVTLLESNGASSTEIPGGDANIVVPGHGATSVNTIVVEGDNKLFITGSLFDVSHVGYDTFTAFVGSLNNDGSFDLGYYGCGYKSFVHPPDPGYLWSISSFSWASLLPTGKILVSGSIGQVAPSNAMVPGMFIVRFSAGEPLGINEQSELPPLIFPNPATNELTISCGNYGNTSFRIIKNSGQQVLQGKLQNGQTHLNIKSLSQGIYFIKLNGESSKAGLTFLKL